MAYFNMLKGEILKSITPLKKDGDIIELHFKTNENICYILYHEEQCCEYVYLHTIDGNIDNLIGSEILQADEIVNDRSDTDYGSETWTFYKLATVKGYVTLRWLGNSNGHYSEKVDFKKVY